MNLHIKTITHILLFFFLFTPMLFANILPPNTLPFQTIKEANEAYEKGEFRKSSMLFQSLKIEDATVLYNQANAEYQAGMYDDALKHYAKSKGIDEATRLYNMGNCYFQKGDFKSAIKQYTASLRLKSDEDVMHNLKLAREKRKEQNKDKKKKDKKKEEPKKKKEEPKKKNQEDKKKNDKKKESDKKNSKSQKDADASKKQESKKKMSPKEKMRKKELSHLIKQLSKRKMPTMMYQGKENKGERNDKNPW